MTLSPVSSVVERLIDIQKAGGSRPSQGTISKVDRGVVKSVVK